MNISKLYYPLFAAKRYLEQLIMWPFVLMGRFIARIKPLNKEYDFILFFPFYHIGGAERVNAEIVQALSDQRILIVFTKKSDNNGMRHFFEHKNADIVDISQWVDNKYLYFLNFIYRGRYAQYINTQADLNGMFIGQCNFGYKLTPHVSRTINITDLVHNCIKEFTWVWAPFFPFIDKRVVISEHFLSAFSKAHEHYGMPSTWIDKYTVIHNCLEYIPNQKMVRSFDTPLKFYYAGRGGEHKRLWLLFEIIEKCYELKLPVQFSLAGSFIDELPESIKEKDIFIGELHGGDEMYQFHKDNDILLMTSGTEGFPIVLMEAMAFGALGIVPAVGGIPDSITHMKTGILLHNVQDEKQFVMEALEQIRWCVENKQEIIKITDNAFALLEERFTKKKFAENYRALFGFKPMS